jgi:hypothetical protein
MNLRSIVNEFPQRAQADTEAAKARGREIAILRQCRCVYMQWILE